MAEIAAAPVLELKVSFVITEAESRALDALVGYGDDAFIKAFYEKLGAACMQEHEKGLRLFLSSIRKTIPGILSRIDRARAEFNK